MVGQQECVGHIRKLGQKLGKISNGKRTEKSKISQLNPMSQKSKNKDKRRTAATCKTRIAHNRLNLSVNKC